MPKVTFVGAGSAVFAYEIITDILLTPALETGVFALVDIDAERLDLAYRIASRLIEVTRRDWRVEKSTNRADVLTGTDYLINTIEVAGLANVRHDYDIPLKYGVDQCIGDTIGPGGIFKALRTLSTWLDILADTQRLAPQALVMNYTNPMSIMCLAGVRTSSLPLVGLCHSIPHTVETLAEYLDVPPESLSFRAAGVNHLAWITELIRDGQDQYPLLVEKMKDPAIYEQDPVRFEMMKHLGAFVTESSGHSSEYVPYFRKRPDLVSQYCRDGYLGESGFYANNWPTWRQKMDDEIRAMLNGDQPIALERGPEYASTIMEAIETGIPTVIYGNVLNTGLVTNLPHDGIVEVACLVDQHGIQPTFYGALPTQLAALDSQHMAVHDLVVSAVLNQDREAAVHALMLDPLTAAVCAPAEIRQMFDEMAAAQIVHLPAWMHS